MVILKTNEVSFSCVNNEAKKTRRGRVAMNDASFISIVPNSCRSIRSFELIHSS